MGQFPGTGSSFLDSRREAIIQHIIHDVVVQKIIKTGKIPTSDSLNHVAHIESLVDNGR